MTPRRPRGRRSPTPLTTEAVSGLLVTPSLEEAAEECVRYLLALVDQAERDGGGVIYSGVVRHAMRMMRVLAARSRQLP